MGQRNALNSVANVAKMFSLHVRSDLHLARKAWHTLMGLFMVGVYMAGLTRSQGVLVLGTFLLLCLAVETARLRIPAFNEIVMKVWGPLMRSCEVNRYSGTPYYIASALIAVGIFPKAIAALAIAFLAVGDPIASLFGILYGDRSIRFSNGKSLIGTAAGMLACAIIAFIFLQFMNQTQFLELRLEHLLILSVIGGLAGGGAELLPMEVDDNFAIPVVSGFVLWLAFIVMGITTV
jgi:diacylglycerol kinase (CTP)